jgi:hypothetical protein
MPIREFTKPLERSQCYEYNTGSQLDKKFPIFYGTQKFITVFTKAYLYQINVIHKFSFSILKFTLILSQPSVSRSSNWSLSSRFHHQNLVYISLLSHLIHTLRPSHPHCLYRHNIRGGLRTKKPLVTQFPPSSLYLLLCPYLFWSALTSNNRNLFYFINLTS